MELTLYLDKTVEQNAAIYFETSKKAKKKLEGATAALIESTKKLAKLEKEKKEKDKVNQQTEQNLKTKTKSEWYEKFRWFISSEGFLVIGGRDATTNEIIIKKFTDKEDIVFHTDMAGSPFFVIKCAQEKKKGKIPSEITLQETANATAIFSRAWKLGMSTLDVFYVSPEQISKTPQSGEYLVKGAFVIRGKTIYLKPDKMEVAIGVKHGINTHEIENIANETQINGKEVNSDKISSNKLGWLGGNKLISGPETSVAKQTKDYIVVEQGREKPSDIAKLFKKKFGGEIDDIIRILPSGVFKVKKR